MALPLSAAPSAPAVALPGPQWASGDQHGPQPWRLEHWHWCGHEEQPLPTAQDPQPHQKRSRKGFDNGAKTISDRVIHLNRWVQKCQKKCLPLSARPAGGAIRGASSCILITYGWPADNLGLKGLKLSELTNVSWSSSMNIANNKPYQMESNRQPRGLRKILCSRSLASKCQGKQICIETFQDTVAGNLSQNIKTHWKLSCFLCFLIHSSLLHHSTPLFLGSEELGHRIICTLARQPIGLAQTTARPLSRVVLPGFWGSKTSWTTFVSHQTMIISAGLSNSHLNHVSKWNFGMSAKSPAGSTSNECETT